MKLVKLTCDTPSFRPIDFNPEGLTLIIGDGSPDNSDEGSSNGVGKTLSLGLIHHCLGAKANPKLSAAVPEWMFRLHFQIGEQIHEIERNGDGKNILLDGGQKSLTTLRTWLNNCGVYNVEENTQGLTFRSLFSRFGRLNYDDCLTPTKTSHESEYDGLLRSSFLLGNDTSLITNKRNNKLEIDAIKASEKNWKNDNILKEILRADAKPKVRAEWLEEELKRIKSDLDAFQVAEDYRQIELNPGELTKQLRDNERKQNILRFQIDGINKSLTLTPDISKNDLLELYEGLQHVFKEESLAHFDAVERFHNSLSVNRQKRLEGDKIEIESQINNLENQRQSIANQRDSLLQSLQGKRALDEYASLTQKYAELREELKRLRDFMSYSNRLQEKRQKINEAGIKEDRTAIEYTRSNPLSEMDKRFKKLANLLYPNLPAGIVLETNTGKNQLRYDLTVNIQGEDSDGINAARIIMFDWLIAMYGANHSMRFLWHDNRLFAHIDPLQRARWFRFVQSSLGGTGKQYIASLNTENYVAMHSHFEENEIALFDSAIKITLSGDKPENKLLGIQFGDHS